MKQIMTYKINKINDVGGSKKDDEQRLVVGNAQDFACAHSCIYLYSINIATPIHPPNLTLEWALDETVSVSVLCFPSHSQTQTTQLQTNLCEVKAALMEGTFLAKACIKI